jgi:hypothetical protein
MAKPGVVEIELDLFGRPLAVQPKNRT